MKIIFSYLKFKMRTGSINKCLVESISKEKDLSMKEVEVLCLIVSEKV